MRLSSKQQVWKNISALLRECLVVALSNSQQCATACYKQINTFSSFTYFLNDENCSPLFYSVLCRWKKEIDVRRQMRKDPAGIYL